TRSSEIIDDTQSSEIIDDTQSSEIIDDTQSSEIIDDTQSSEIIDDTQSSEIVDDTQNLETVLEKLSLKDSRKVVKSLIAKNIIQSQTSLKGKGCNTKYFVSIVQSHLSRNREAIIDILHELTPQVLVVRDISQ
ncbi:MAG: hypothetical protein AAF349_12115, partial [Cyanobacteria bacterium P01_A01_bin.68]